MKRAIFIDRDGTINKEVNGVLSPKDLRLLPKTAEALKEFKRLGFLTLVITNQGFIARGKLTEEKLGEIHNELLRRLAKKGALIDSFYYCPHHPKGIRKEYPLICQCRKPDIALIEKALKEHNISKEGSFFIGDTTRDILAGKRAGIKTILVETGYAGKDKKHEVEADFTAKNLFDAVSIVKKHGK